MNGWLRYNVRCSADVAQSVEHLIGNEEVGSSNLLISSKTEKTAPPKGCCFSVICDIMESTLDISGFCATMMESTLSICEFTYLEDK